MSKMVVDIGGNGVQYSINSLDNIKSFSTIDKDKDFVLQKLADIANENNIKILNISSPCGVDSKTGYLYGMSGIKNYGNFNLYDELNALINKDIKISAYNDANAALLGNLYGEEYDSAAQITIGTGIGGALFINGKIHTGQNALAGEFGYIPFDRSNTNTSQNCSANALVRMINEENNTSFKNVIEALESKNDISATVTRWSKNVAKLITQVYFSIAPDVIFISGGVTKNKFILEEIQKSLLNIMDEFAYDFKIELKFKNIDNPALLGMWNV